MQVCWSVTIKFDERSRTRRALLKCRPWLLHSSLEQVRKVPSVEVPQYQGAKGRFCGGESLLSYTITRVAECQLSTLMTVVQESVPETNPWSPDSTQCSTARQL